MDDPGTFISESETADAGPEAHSIPDLLKSTVRGPNTPPILTPEELATVKMTDGEIVNAKHEYYKGQVVSVLERDLRTERLNRKKIEENLTRYLFTNKELEAQISIIDANLDLQRLVENIMPELTKILTTKLLEAAAKTKDIDVYANALTLAIEKHKTEIFEDINIYLDRTNIIRAKVNISLMPLGGPDALADTIRYARHVTSQGTRSKRKPSGRLASFMWEKLYNVARLGIPSIKKKYFTTKGTVNKRKIKQIGKENTELSQKYWDIIDARYKFMVSKGIFPYWYLLEYGNIGVPLTSNKDGSWPTPGIRPSRIISTTNTLVKELIEYYTRTQVRKSTTLGNRTQEMRVHIANLQDTLVVKDRWIERMQGWLQELKIERSPKLILAFMNHCIEEIDAVVQPTIYRNQMETDTSGASNVQYEAEVRILVYNVLFHQGKIPNTKRVTLGSYRTESGDMESLRVRTVKLSEIMTEELNKFIAYMNQDRDYIKKIRAQFKLIAKESQEAIHRINQIKYAVQTKNLTAEKYRPIWF